MEQDFQVIDRRHSAQPELQTSAVEAPTPVDAAHLGSGTDPHAGKRSFHEKWDDELKVPGEDDPQMQAEIAEYEAREHRESKDPETLETLAQLREDNCAAVKPYQWEKQEELGEQHEKERLGRILHANEFLKKLHDCGLRCWYSAPAKEFEGKAAGLQVVNHGKPEYVCFVQAPYMPEFSVMRFDDHGAPTSEKYRGWRTVLLRLLTAGMVTEDTVNRVFGRATGSAARRWDEALMQLRNA